MALTIPEGRRFEATQALREVRNRAVAWGLLDSNAAEQGVPEPTAQHQGETAV